MLRLNERQRSVLIEKLPDVANGVIVAALFGQFLTGQRYSMGVALAGIAVWIFFWVLTLAMAKDDRP